MPRRLAVVWESWIWNWACAVAVKARVAARIVRRILGKDSKEVLGDAGVRGCAGSWVTPASPPLQPTAVRCARFQRRLFRGAEEGAEKVPSTSRKRTSAAKSRI